MKGMPTIDAFPEHDIVQLYHKLAKEVVDYGK